MDRGAPRARRAGVHLQPRRPDQLLRRRSTSRPASPTSTAAPRMRKAMDRQVALETAAHEILRPAFLCWPDVVLLVSAFWYPPYLLDVMRGRGMKVVLLHTESPYQDDEQLERAAHADLNLLNDPVNIAAYRGARPRRVHAARLPAARPLPAAARRRDRSGTWRSSAPGSPSGSRSSRPMDLAGLDVHLAGPVDGPPRRLPAARLDRPRRWTTASTTTTPPRSTGRPAPGSTSTAANPRTPTQAKGGPSAPARSRWPRAAPGSPATPAPNPTSCSHAARVHQPGRGGGPDPLGPQPPRRSGRKPPPPGPRRRSRTGRSTQQRQAAAPAARRLVTRGRTP